MRNKVLNSFYNIRHKLGTYIQIFNNVRYNKLNKDLLKLVWRCRNDNLYMRCCCITNLGQNNRILFGNNCILVGMSIFMCDSNNSVVIGNNVHINAYEGSLTCLNACNGVGVYIGDNCLLSNGIEIHTTDYHKLFSDGERYNYPKDIVIGKGTWIGLKTVILKGTEIPEHSVIGCCSLVNKKFTEPHTIIAGNPARVVKTNVEWN